MCLGGVVLFSHRNEGGIMNFDELNNEWLDNDMPIACEVKAVEEVEEVVINIPAVNGKLHDDFEGE